MYGLEVLILHLVYIFVEPKILYICTPSKVPLVLSVPLVCFTEQILKASHCFLINWTVGRIGI
jgi:hypothetical protein